MIDPAETYRSIYERELETEAAWLAYGARAKVDALQLLLGRNQLAPERIVELGCGTGAVLAECARRKLARDFVGVDYAPEAIAYVTARHELRGHVANLEDPGFRYDEPCDVAVMSHVVEHLRDPLAVLRRVAKAVPFSKLVVEVPLEDLALARVKALVRDRTRNTAGHVQFFTRRSFRALLQAAGLRIVDEHIYVPVLSRAMMRTISERHGFSRAAHALHLATNTYLPRMLEPLWKRVYYAHHAALCTRA